MFRVTVKPRASPALTVAASAVLVTLRSGQLTVTEAVALLLDNVVEASFVAVAEAVLLTLPQLADEVVATICTVELPPAFRLVGV